jgi:type II restriction/modification system DNA methylase subunit YeeA
MDTAKLKKFAQYARRSLIDQVSNKLVLVLAEDSAARRENAAAIKKLEEQISEHGKDQVIEKIAYIWFNRFCALRFMDVNRYTRIGLVSPVEGQFQPEILAEAKMGHIDEDTVPEKIRQQIFALLGGTAPSQDPQTEAYRLLVVAACNNYYKAMPYLFERIADYTELIMPDDLLSGNSILAYTREAMTPNICQNVEVIGWLYQFYISEKKDKVFDDLKKNKKITPENIPAATQLFTPHWIVRYLVENSLGRLWMLNRPNSKLFEKMEYFIRPEDVETDFLRINKAEDLKIVDPACGSGHMLVYAFDLLYAIYEEEGVDPSEIPEKILSHNLYGIEIDERAGELAAFALTMKARAKQRRFFRKPVQPNICVLENILLDERELNEYMDFVGQDIFTLGLKTTLHQFEEADNFGSLIRPEVTDVDSMLMTLEAKNVSGDILLSQTHQKVLRVLKQADYLSPKYHVVIANPPYMGGKGMNGKLGAWAKDNYPASKSDLFSMFIERGLEMIPRFGYSAMVTMESWMFLSSYEKLRSKLLKMSMIQCMVHMPYLGKGGTSMGISFGTSATVFNKTSRTNFKGQFCCVRYFETNDFGVPLEFPPRNERLSKASTADFNKIPGSPIAYWVSSKVREIFESSPALKEVSNPKQGTSTGNDEKYVRFWFEIQHSLLGIGIKSLAEALQSGFFYFPLDKGGDFRRWYGNNEKVIKFDRKSYSELLEIGNHLPSREKYFLKGITWSKITSAKISVRYDDFGFVFSSVGLKGFPGEDKILIILAYMNSILVQEFTKFLSPTLSIVSGDIEKLPYIVIQSKEIDSVVDALLSFAKADWDSYETSWDFISHPLLHPDYRQSSLKATYTQLRIHWRETTLEMQRLEQKNNRIFIDAYGLQDELTQEVPLNEITLTFNPHYRYGSNKNEEELETLLLADTMKELISYAVGCIFGRYSLDKPGLILANQGETIADYLKQIPEPIFSADDDNVIPMLDGDWFTDDVTERFGKFLKVTFGDIHYEENLKFIEQALGKEIRKYFLKDFYTDHLKRYKKRPIYWLFSSPKGTFNALIYMHRYRPDTVSVVLNDYLREFRTKLSAHKNHLEAVSISSNASAGEKTKALKDIENHRKMIDELDVYEREVLYPLATEQIEIDLDDGVKVNYQKFGEALKKIPGLAAKED